MEARTQRARATTPGASQSVDSPVGEAAELDYSPKKMTPRETLIVSVKLALAAVAVFGLLWLAHVKLEK